MPNNELTPLTPHSDEPELHERRYCATPLLDPWCLEAELLMSFDSKLRSSKQTRTLKASPLEDKPLSHPVQKTLK